MGVVFHSPGSPDEIWPESNQAAEAWGKPSILHVPSDVSARYCLNSEALHVDKIKFAALRYQMIH